MQDYVLIIFLWTFQNKLLYFADKFQETGIFAWKIVNWEKKHFPDGLRK